MRVAPGVPPAGRDDQPGFFEPAIYRPGGLSGTAVYRPGVHLHQPPANAWSKAPRTAAACAALHSSGVVRGLSGYTSVVVT